MEKILEEYQNASKAYAQLNAENKAQINLLVAELLKAQQSQHQ